MQLKFATHFMCKTVMKDIIRHGFIFVAFHEPEWDI